MPKNSNTDGFVERAEPILQTEVNPTKSFDTDQLILQQIKQVVKQRSNGFHDNSLPIVEVSIPQTVTIDCPLMRPMLRHANQCKQCNYFHGIVQSAWSDEQELSWSMKYAIRCGFVLERKTQQVVVE